MIDGKGAPRLRQWAVSLVLAGGLAVTPHAWATEGRDASGDRVHALKLVRPKPTKKPRGPRRVGTYVACTLLALSFTGAVSQIANLMVAKQRSDVIASQVSTEHAAFTQRNEVPAGRLQVAREWMQSKDPVRQVIGAQEVFANSPSLVVSTPTFAQQLAQRKRDGRDAAECIASFTAHAKQKGFFPQAVPFVSEKLWSQRAMGIITRVDTGLQEFNKVTQIVAHATNNDTLPPAAP